jgi:hypothetical protein
MGVKACFSYFAADTFYYLTVAKQSTLTFFTYDGELRTNGFHPLWQFILTASFRFIPDSSPHQLLLTFLLSLFLVAIGVLFSGYTIHRETGSFWAPLWLIPGPIFLIFSIRGYSGFDFTGGTYMYSPWNFMNGMESPLTIMFGGVFLYMVHKCHRRYRGGAGATSGKIPRSWSLGLGLLLAALVLSRLDNIFLAFAMALFSITLDDLDRGNLTRTFFISFPPILALIAFILFNSLTGQTPLPVSGLVKSTSGAAFSGNLAFILSDLFPPLHFLVRPEYGIDKWPISVVRTSMIAIPIIFTVIFSALTFLESDNRRDQLIWLTPLVAFIVFKSLYNLINVRIGSQGYWYYALPTLFINYMIIVLAAYYLRGGANLRGRVPTFLMGAIYTPIYLFSAANMIYTGALIDSWNYSIWKDRKQITRELKIRVEDPKIIDRSDGVVAYSLDLPSINSLGYAMDYQSFRAKQEDRLMEHLLKRGFNVTFESPRAYPLRFVERGFSPILEHEPSGTVFGLLRPMDLDD